MKAHNTQKSTACRGPALNLGPLKGAIQRGLPQEIPDHPVSCTAVLLHSLLVLQELSQSGFFSPLKKTGLCVRKKKNNHNVIDWTSVLVEKVVNLWCEAMYKKHVIWEKARSLYKYFHIHKVDGSGHHQSLLMSRICVPSQRGHLLKWSQLTGMWRREGIRS